MATELASAEAYDAWIAANARGIVHFWAPWCEPCAAMDVLLETLAKRHPDVAIARCDAEAVEAVAAAARAAGAAAAAWGGRTVVQSWMRSSSSSSAACART